MITKVGEQYKKAGIPSGTDWMNDLGKPTGKSFGNLPINEKAKTISDFAGVGSKGMLAALGAGLVLKNFWNKIQNDTRRKALIEDLMLNDPIIKNAPKEQVMAFYATINNVAPSIALDKNVTKDLLHQFITFGTIDVKTIQLLADTHSAIDKNNATTFDRFLK